MPLLRQAQSLDVPHCRARVLAQALATSETFRQFMAKHRAARPLQDEAELWWMLDYEVNAHRNSQPRRSMVKRLHGAIVNVRQRREWTELQKMLK